MWQRVSPPEAAIALQTLLRRVGLFRQLRDQCRQRAVFPQEAVEGLTDEQYVRNVVDVLFRARTDPNVAPAGAANRQPHS